MKAKFFGGPYDGKEFDRVELNKAGIIISLDPHLLMMPPLHYLNKYLAGEMKSGDFVDGMITYERRRPERDRIEFHCTSPESGKHLLN